MAAVQRLRQGVRALTAFSRPVAVDLAEHYLSASELALFHRMQRSEQLHSLNVLRHVLAQGSTPPSLAAAALLHDAGKIHRPLRVWQKTLVVLVRALLPPLYRRLIQGSPENFWVRPFAVSVQHPQWSADLLADAGSSETVIWLAAHHQDSPEQWTDHAHYTLLKRLQQADDAN
jgi:hypothetical protein